MAETQNGSALIKYGPIGAPALGLVLMLAFIGLMFVLGDTDAPRREIDTTVSKINSRLQDPKKSPDLKFTAEGVGNAPTGIAVSPNGKPGSMVPNEHGIMDYPIQFRVVLGKGGDTGEKPEDLDLDNDGKLSQSEYAQSKRRTVQGVHFKSLDNKPASTNPSSQDGDGYINYRTQPDEWNQTVSEADTEFDLLDKNEDENLNQDEYSAGGKSDFKAKDTDNNGGVSRKEFRVGPVVTEKADLAPPTDVTAVADSKNFVINVSWTAPALAVAPKDLGYWIERYSPKDKGERDRRYNDELVKWNDKKRQWEKRRDDWKKINPGKSDKDYEKVEAAPVKPAKPSDWERLNDVPCKETKWADRTFKTESTYIYAVRSTTQEELKPEVKTNIAFVEGYKSSEQAMQQLRPVVIYNKIIIIWAGKSDVAKVKLQKFHPINGEWKLVEFAQELSADGARDLGAMLTPGEIKSPTVIVHGPEGKPDPAALAALQASRDSLDFRTDWTFTGFNGSDFEFSAKNGGAKFVLPKDTNKPADIAPSDPGAMANPLTVRIFAVNGRSTPQTATFEITRWKKIEGDKWIRIVLWHDVKKSEPVGIDAAGMVKALNESKVKVYNEGGDDVTSIAKTKNWVAGVSTETGLSFEGVDKRTILLGTEKLDIFGVLYVDK